MALFVLISPLSAHAAVDRAIVEGVAAGSLPGLMYICAHFMDGATEAELRCQDFNIGPVYTEQQMITAAEAMVDSYAALQGYTLSGGIVWPFLTKEQTQSLINSSISASTTVATSSSLSLSLQTSTGAVGTQVSTTSGAWVAVAGQVSTTASIAGNAAGDIIVEVAPTNSATAGDWVEWGRIGNSQALSLAITLQSVQIVKGQVYAWVPKNWYVKARTSGSGTVSYQLNTVRKVTQ